MELVVPSDYFGLAQHGWKNSEQDRRLALDAARGSRTRRVARLELHRLLSGR